MIYHLPHAGVGVAPAGGLPLKSPLYKRACVFFSSQLPKHELERIKQSPTLLSRLAALRSSTWSFWP